MRHRPQLDSLRALAVILVLYTHLYDEQSHLGRLGVRLFFVLSGYLVTGILLEHEPERSSAGSLRQLLTSFYIRRGLRLWPAFYSVLLLSAAWGLLEIRRYFFWHAAYLSNVLFAYRGNYAGGWVTCHLWSLSVEEQFYLLWPAALLATPARSRPLVCAVAVGLGVGYQVLAWGLGFSENAAFFLLPALLDALILGALLAVFEHQGQPYRTPLNVAALISGATFVTVCALTATPTQVFDILLVLPLVALVAVCARGVTGPLGRVLSAATLQYLGRISYGIYLYHLFVMYVTQKVAGPLGLPQDRGVAMLITCSVASVVVAAASYRWLETPFNRLKARFPYSAQSHAPAAAGELLATRSVSATSPECVKSA